MRKVRFVVALMVLLSLLLTSSAGWGQDFILQGCYWDCPDDGVAELDPEAFRFWVSKMEDQATELAHAGFSYMWLPAFYIQQKQPITKLISALGRAGIETIADVNSFSEAFPGDSLAYPVQQMYQLEDNFGIRSFRLTGQRDLSASFMRYLLDSLQRTGKVPGLLMVRSSQDRSPENLAEWANQVAGIIQTADKAPVDPRVFDYPLREALRLACTDTVYDVRNLYQQSIRDVTALSGYKIITFINSPEFYNPNGIEGDADDLITDPLLAYAYILTNNQLGLPMVFYGDYFGEESEIEFFIDKAPLKEDIDQLIKAHREYIFNATAVEYLNRPDTDKNAYYLSAGTGADASRALIFQLDGTNTPAGKASTNGGRDVIVAINFADTTLQVVQEINMSNAAAGDYFTDILGRSNLAASTVEEFPEYQMDNAVYLELPARSYSIWVQGRAEKVMTSLIDFSAHIRNGFTELIWEVPEEDYITGYQVERSVNGKAFKTIDYVEALGKKGELTTYLAADADIFPNENLYYRITATGKKKVIETSPIRHLKVPGADWTLEILNERGTLPRLCIRSNFNDRITLTVFDAEGQKLFTRQQEIKSGVNTSDIDLSAYPKGIYLISLTNSENRSWTKKVVKM